MQTIVFIGTNKSGSTREAIKAAERMGYFTVLLTNRRRFLQQRTEFPDVHEMIFNDLKKESIIDSMRKLERRQKKIVGILSFMDSYVHLASELSDEWGISSFSTEALRLMENKIFTNEVLKDAFSPDFDVYPPRDSFKEFLNRQKGKSKWIVKLPESTGSKDVMLAEDKNSLKRAIKILAGRQRNQPVLIEEFLDGPQYLVEAVVDQGIVHIVAVIKQDFSELNPFIVTGYSIQPDLEEDFYQKLHADVSSIIQSFKMTKGACHLELRLVKGEWKVIEVNPRISGGAMNAMIQEAYGINLVEQTIRLYLGQTPNLIKEFSRHIYTHYLTINETGKLLRVTGANQTRKLPDVKKVYIKPRKGMILRPPSSMGKRYGYVMATGATANEARDTAIQSGKNIEFHLELL